MKKSLLTLALAGLGLVGYAQLEQGKILLGGNFSFSSDNSDEMDDDGTLERNVKTGSFDLGLRAGYFLVDNVAVGLTGGFGSSKTTSENYGTAPAKSTDISKYSNTWFGLFGRMYKMMGESRFALFGQLDFTYGMGKNSWEDQFVNSAGISTSQTRRGESTSVNVALSPGLSFFLSDRLALEATFGNIGYSTTNQKDYDTADRFDSESKSSRLSVSFNPSSIFFGITFFIGGGGGDGAAK